MDDTETSWTARTDWETMPCPGLVPHFHGDPAVDGAPQASADGHWWWDGRHWTPVHVPTLAHAETAAQASAPDPTQGTAPTEDGTQPAQPAPAWARAS